MSPDAGLSGANIRPPARLEGDDWMSYTLVYTEGDRSIEQRLDPGQIVLGRAPMCDVVLNHHTVSRQHARLVITAADCVINDLGSRNGTFVNGQQIDRASVGPGDRILLGQCALELRSIASDDVVLTDDDAGLSVEHVIDGQATDAGLIGTTVNAGRLLKLMSDISRTLVGTLPIDEVLAHVVDLAFDSTQATRALLLLYDRDTRQLVPRVVRHRGSDEGSTRISRTILNKVLRERVSMLATNAPHDPRLDYSQSMVALRIRSFMCAPLWHDNDIVGILYVDNPQSHGFTRADLDLFTAFSNYAAVAISQARLTASLADETRRREHLGRYHSPAVVDRILQSAERDVPFFAQERDLTVLFADIVGFTTISEELPAQQVATLLNGYFTRMADAIFRHDGTLDKFIGDGVLAIFGAPMELPTHALNAVRAAQDMRRALRAFNEEGSFRPLEMRVAIHSGMALVGDIGSPQRREYSVLGDVVNTASRMERTVAQGGEIVITRAVLDRIENQLTARPRGWVQLRGRAEPVEVFDIPSD